MAERGRVTQRFWLKVDKTRTCWLWTASRDPKGYGRFKLNDRPVLAHRFAYETLIGPIPDGLQLDHLCRTRNCVNPSHLEPVSNRDNALRGTGHTAANAAKTHCLNGHEFTPENTRVKPPSPVLPFGARQCRECERRREQARGPRPSRRR